MKVKFDAPGRSKTAGNEVSREVRSQNGGFQRGRPIDIGPVGYSGPQFENSWRIPEGMRWVTIWTSGPTSFNVTFTKEEPK